MWRKYIIKIDYQKIIKLISESIIIMNNDSSRKEIFSLSFFFCLFVFLVMCKIFYMDRYVNLLAEWGATKKRNAERQYKINSN